MEEVKWEVKGDVKEELEEEELEERAEGAEEGAAERGSLRRLAEATRRTRAAAGERDMLGESRREGVDLAPVAELTWDDARQRRKRLQMKSL